jgi:hypothetical protein
VYHAVLIITRYDADLRAILVHHVLRVVQEFAVLVITHTIRAVLNEDDLLGYLISYCQAEDRVHQKEKGEGVQAMQKDEVVKLNQAEEVKEVKKVME